MTRYCVGDVSNMQIRGLERDLSSVFEKYGIFFRLFSRIKEEASLNEKICKKRKSKNDSDYKVTDYIGFRVVLYFKDDIDICTAALCSKFDKIEKIVDTPSVNEFSPVRINYVFKMPEEYFYLIPQKLNNTVENTFEVQIRTIFSEGWHEIEHDFRYKCKEDWGEYAEYSRHLNGIFATLENCDWSITSLFNDLAYQNYRNKEWEMMVKHKFRLRFMPDKLSPEIIRAFNNDNNIAKYIYKTDRNKIILDIAGRLPLCFDNIVYYIIKFENINTVLTIPELIEKLYNDNSSRPETI